MLLVAAPVPAAAAAAAPSVRYRFTDPRIDEASGLAVGVRSPGVDYVQNDSGDSARFFAVDAATGRTAATITVPGATNVDWEDLAVAPAPPDGRAAGRSSVWLADIGDNDAVRPEIRVYRVDEPRIAADARNRSVRTVRPDVWRLRYPDGPVNAESFAVTPSGTGYIVTKSLVGASVVYRLPPHPDPDRVQTLVRVGTITFRAHPSGVPFGTVGTLTATGAALSHDGTVLAVRTYADAFVWRVRDGDLAAALRQPATRVSLPAEPQGEGVAVDEDQLLVDSEGVGTAVYSVPLPVPPAGPQAAASSLEYGSLPLTFVPDATGSDHGRGTGSRSLADSGTVVGAAAVVLIVAAAAAATVAWRRRRPGRRAR